MRTIKKGFLLLVPIISMLLCFPPENPFQENDSVSLKISVPEKEGGFKYCINEKVKFEVTIYLPYLVKKITIHYDENGDKDEREITTEESEHEKISFSYEYKEKGLKKAKFIITFRKAGEERAEYYDIEIGVFPAIRNEKKLVALGDIKLGKPIALTVEHQEFSKATYKWYKDSKLLPEKDKQSLVLNPLKERDAGLYHCIVTTEWGKDQSEPFILSFNTKKAIDPPEIQNHPQSVQATAGNSAVFTISAKGEELEYQWQKNEENIPGANDTSYEVTDLKPGNNATFRCIVSNKAGSDTSENADLEVFENEIAPKITKHPEDREADAGDAVQFSIEAEGTNLNYRWYKDDQAIENENAVQAVL
ncbi:MAG: immunoglobulin domain-containing protein, partial [Chitinispirillia bacterium]